MADNFEEREVKPMLKCKEYRFKVVIVGTYGVGKTSLMLQHFDRHFTDEPKTTVGVDFRQKCVQIGDATVRLEAWDTAGVEKYANILQIYYRGADAVIAVYDVRKRPTYTRALDYIDEITSQTIEAPVVALVGNKCDLLCDGDDDREVLFETAFKYGAKTNAIFMETSAKTASNVDQLFDAISHRLIEKRLKRQCEAQVRKQLRLHKAQVVSHRKRCC